MRPDSITIRLMAEGKEIQKESGARLRRENDR